MQKIKSFFENEKGKDLLVVLIVFLVGLSSFYLGRLSKDNPDKGLKIEYNGQEASVLGSLSQNKANPGQILIGLSLPQNSSKTTEREYFASSRGKKYYPINCSAGKTIKQENRIYFKTSSEAEQAGYELSNSCR